MSMYAFVYTVYTIVLVFHTSEQFKLYDVTSITGRTEADAARWLKIYSKQMEQAEYSRQIASWNYKTNVTEHNSQLEVAAKRRIGKFDYITSQIAAEFPYDTFKDPTIRRLLSLIAFTPKGNCTGSDAAKQDELINRMISIYSDGKICPPANRHCDSQTEGWTFEEDISEYLVNSRNYSDLEYVWEKWRDVTGKEIKGLYKEYAKLEKAAANCMKYKSVQDEYLSKYQKDLKDQNFNEVLEKLWKQVFPLYEQLHGYVRHKLIQFYGDEYTMAPDEPIPAHIFGNMWAQQWTILDIVKPFKQVHKQNLTEALEKKGYTVTKIAKAAEQFYKSIGFLPMPKSFWDLSMLEKPKDNREVVCHASASNFFLHGDVRIKMCGTVTDDTFNTIHHEMGHCEYFLLYNDQHVTFRDGANPGFHEAVGDTMILSAHSPSHLLKLGLYDHIDDSEEERINELMSKALDSIAFLPFSYLIDLWRWQVLNGDIKHEEANKIWWELREQYQGVVPPVMRRTDDFDPAAKFHVPATTPYIRYFIARILEFSFYRSACEASGHPSTEPLHTCDFYNSKAAGERLANGLKLGSALPWPDILEIMTGSRQIDCSAILQYFEPLMQFLKKYNKENNVPVGWKTGVYKKFISDDNQ